MTDWAKITGLCMRLPDYLLSESEYKSALINNEFRDLMLGGPPVEFGKISSTAATTASTSNETSVFKREDLIKAVEEFERQRREETERRKSELMSRANGGLTYRIEPVKAFDPSKEVSAAPSSDKPTTQNEEAGSW